ncbi:proline--tRNA ligase [Halobacteriales archaeon SW_12_69_24]|nr:MAG: proline--tRNA ligase [Halobacteriales archaeon SW_12_69_24]
MSGEQDLGITESKAQDPGDWYAEVVRKAGLAAYAPMGGFIVTRPRGYAVWERIRGHLDRWFKDTGVDNAYFPMFIPEGYLEREKDVVEGFDPEVAWVTHGGHDELDERLYEEVMAIPAVTGRKPDHDKFPGADTTTTVEALMPDGKSVQGCTSHYLGTSFAEAFDITYTDEDEAEHAAHTTSWGLSWRAMGALIMTHSDDQGLVLPPALAPTQVVVVPIWQSDTAEAVTEYAADLAADLDGEYRVDLDDRDERNPGFKFNEHELNGVPLRVEVGPNEVEDGAATLVHRPDGESEVVEREAIGESVGEALDTVHAKLYADAESHLEDNVREAHGRGEILGTIGKHGGYVETGWCGAEACDDEIKDEIAAEIVMLPLEEDEEPVHETCGVCGEEAVETAYFAKSY